MMFTMAMLLVKSLLVRTVILMPRGEIILELSRLIMLLPLGIPGFGFTVHTEIARFSLQHSTPLFINMIVAFSVNCLSLGL